MEVRDWLRTLPDPDPAAVSRVWSRYRETRKGPRDPSPRRWWLAPVGAALAVAALALWSGRDRPTRIELTSGTTPFGATVSLTTDGRGAVSGTGRDVTVAWESGDVSVEVEPHTGTRLKVVTDEAVVEVVGTLFSVHRDALGATVGVTRGRVEVSCLDGWHGFLSPDEPAHTCVPVRPGALLGRADALKDRGAAADEILDALDRGLSAASPGSAVEGELLARRIDLRAGLAPTASVLADAERYLAGSDRPRATEVRRTASRLALADGGCPAALRWLEPLEATGTAEDRVVLASCLADADPARARALAAAALRSGEPVDPDWRAWAERFVAEGH
jgi:ferric-dicitrate binding protein FerR (iron transport regulator)